MINSTDVFTWTYTPADFFEDTIEIVVGDQTVNVQPGKLEARVESSIFSADPSIRDVMHAAIAANFSGVQTLTDRPFELS